MVLGATATPESIAALRGIGLDAVPHQALPMVAVHGPVLATRAASAPFVRSLWGGHRSAS